MNRPTLRLGEEVVIMNHLYCTLKRPSQRDGDQSWHLALSSLIFSCIACVGNNSHSSPKANTSSESGTNQNLSAQAKSLSSPKGASLTLSLPPDWANSSKRQLSVTGMDVCPATGMDSDKTPVYGSGHVVTESRNVGPFIGVALCDIGSLNLNIDSNNAVNLKADDNLLDALTTSVTSGVLNFAERSSITVRAGQIELNAEAPSIQGIYNYGAGDVKVKGVSGGRIVIGLSGNGRISISGTADSLEVQGEGQGVVDSSKLAVKTAKVTAHDGASIRLNSLGQITIDSDSSSTVTNVALDK